MSKNGSRIMRFTALQQKKLREVIANFSDQTAELQKKRLTLLNDLEESNKKLSYKDILKRIMRM